MAVDTLAHLLALQVTAAYAQERTRVAQLAAQVPEGTGDAVEVVFVDRGYSCYQPAQDAAHGVHLAVMTLPAAKHGFVLLPRRWVVERSFARAVRFRRLAGDDERPPITLAGCLAWSS
jgi:transposase